MDTKNGYFVTMMVVRLSFDGMKKFLFILMSLPVYSQTLEGFVVDSLTKEILPFANITLLGKNVGTSTNENGFFKLDISQNKQDSLFVSFIGYQNTLLSLENYIENKTYSTTILLSPKPEKIEEVIVSKSIKYENKKFTLGTFNQKKNYPSSVPFGYEKAVFIENRREKIGKIENITFYFGEEENNTLYEKKTAIFKISFYKKGKDEYPNEYILNETFLLKPEKQKKIKLHFSDVFIPFPKQGIFVGIEVVNPSTEMPKSSLYITSPSLIHTHVDKSVSFSRFRGKKWNQVSKRAHLKTNSYTSPKLKIQVSYQE